MTCNAEIPPEWVAAINSGVCPGCGGQMYSDEHKQLLEELRTAMEEMKSADAESITGWLLSNYRLTKIGEAEPTQFHRKPNQVQAQAQERGDIPTVKVADNPVKEYLDRAGYSKKKDLRAIASRLKQAAGSDESANMYVNPEEIEDEYPEDYQEEHQSAEPLAKKVLANNSVVLGGGGSEGPPLSPQEQAAIMETLSQGDPGVSGDIPAPLQAARMAKLQKQKAALDGGGGKNSFRRGY